MRLGQTLFGAAQGSGKFVLPLRRGMTETPHEESETGGGHGGIDVDDRIDQGVEPLLAKGVVD